MSWTGWLTEKDLEECWDGVDPQPFLGKSILVTGSTGCIGGGIAEALVWKLRGTGTKVHVSGRRTEILKTRYGKTDAILLECDLTQSLPPDWPIFDFVVHAASPASPKFYLATPVDTLLSNALGLQSLLSHGTSNPDCRYLYISSGEIYGSPDDSNVPTPETYVAATDPLDARACYTEAKRFGESLAMAWKRQADIKMVISRPIHVYGPGLMPDDGRAICDFVSKAVRKEPIVMLSDGTATRGFCYLSDATRLHLQLLSQAPSGTVCNVGRESPSTSIRALAEQASSLFGPVEITFKTAEYVSGSPQQSRPSTAQARKLFSYEPQVELAEGMRRLANFWRLIGAI